MTGRQRTKHGCFAIKPRETGILPSSRHRRRSNMTKILLATALLIGATHVTLAQSAYTTGTIASSEDAGYPGPSAYGRGLYAYAPDYRRRYARHD